MLQNLRLKTKLMLIVAIPFFVSLMFGGTYIAEAYKTNYQMERISALVTLGTKMSALVHESQKERGMSAGYIGSKGKKFADKLPEQQKLFNQKLDELSSALAVFDSQYYSAELEELVKSAVAHIGKTDAIRARVKALDIPLGQALGHYTALNGMLIEVIEQMSKVSADARVTTEIVAFTNFLESKERAGIERAVLTNTFARDNFAKGFYKKFIELVTAQDVYIDMFLEFGTPERAEFYIQTMKDPSVAEVQRLRDIANDKADTGGFGVEATYWFSTITKKINKLKEVENHLADELILLASEKANHAHTMLFIYLGLLVLSLLVISVLTVFVVKRINLSVASLKHGMEHVISRGDFAHQVSAEGKDEFAEISQHFNQFTARLKNMIGDSNSVLQSIAEGDFSQRIALDAAGDLARLKDGVNHSAQSVAFMMEELSKVMAAMNEGRFDAKMDAKVPSRFSDQVHQALGNIDATIQDINAVMTQMNRGQFSARVNATSKGQLAELKDNINASMVSLNAAISEIKEVIQAQAAGNLTLKMNGKYQGELEDVKSAINQSNQALDAAIAASIVAANTVNEAASEVAEGATGLSQRVQEQAASIEQSSATMEQFSSGIKQNASNAQHESEIERVVERKTSEASEVMNKTIEAMNQIQESSQKIADIVTLIDGIAFQTNLLALNAAVEAARAGEHGRGFAVVAGEVRALAQKSADAAKDITSLINESVERINAGTKLASISGQAIDEITQSIEEVSQMSHEISKASSEQAKGIEQLHLTFQNIDQMTQQNAALVEETSAAAEAMQSQATDLHQRLAFFRTSSASVAQSPAAVQKKPAASMALPAKSVIPLAKSKVKASDEWDDF